MFALKKDNAWSLMYKARGPLTHRIEYAGAVPMALPNLPAEEGFLMPGANVGALIAKIDDMVFAVGSRYDNAAPAEGVIFLAMNENPEHNNQAGIVGPHKLLSSTNKRSLLSL